MARTRKAGAVSRRVFLQNLTFVGGGVLLYACKRDEASAPPRRARSVEVLTTSHLTFTDPEYETVSAACERMLPKDGDPGAVEAHVPGYIDKILQTPELAQMKKDFLGGIDALERRSHSMFKVGFAKAHPDQQDTLISLFKNAEAGTGEAHFYELLLALTMEGFLGDPSYGGNHDRVGWRLVGFDTAEPPPGYDGTKFERY